MTKTIEERAKEYEENYPNMDDSYYSYYIRDGYIEGATDQRRIDIEKACYFIKRNTTLDRWVNVDAIAEQLRKAMEDEQ